MRRTEDADPVVGTHLEIRGLRVPVDPVHLVSFVHRCHAEIGDWVIMAGYAGVHQFGKVGAHAFLGNNAAVTRDVPPYLLVSGMPAEPKGVNSEGLRRRGFTPEQIVNIKNAYRVLYRSGLKLAEATQRLAELAETQPEVGAFVDFLGRATRSIVR